MTSSGTLTIDYDSDLPVALDLGAGGTLEFGERVRVVPGRRMVCSGTWNEEAVFAKIYAGSGLARRDFERERSGNDALHRAGIAAPEVLWYGSTPGRDALVIVYAAIVPAVGLGPALTESDEAGFRDLIMQLVTVVAQHHEHRLYQRDMHWGNFLLGGDCIYTLDGGDIREKGGNLGFATALDNLALLLSQLDSRRIELMKEAYVQYLSHRHISERIRPFDHLLVVIERHRTHRQRRYLRKIFRESSDFACRQESGRFSVCARGYLAPDLEWMLEHPELFVDEGEILKAGNTSTVARVEVDDVMLVAKRYNIKSTLHGVRTVARRSRAARSWRNAHLLRLCDIDTANPVALIEQRESPIRRHTWFIMREVVGRTALDYFADPTVAAKERERSAALIAEILAALARNNISHGDLKASNFLVTPKRVALIDLDAMRHHRSAVSFGKARQRDLDRFMRNWEALPEVAELFRELGVG